MKSRSLLRYGPKLVSLNPSEDLDWNDRLKRGELDPLLLGWLGEIKSRCGNSVKRLLFGSKDHQEKFYQVSHLAKEENEDLPEFLKTDYRGGNL